MHKAPLKVAKRAPIRTVPKTGISNNRSGKTYKLP